jgi:hypothetical protein
MYHQGRKVAAYFRSANRNTKLKEYAARITGEDGSREVAKVKPQLDLNGTRMASQHNLLLSLIRLNKALQVPWAAR